MNAHDLPERLPVFPLPEIVLFPGVPLPLHIFEPRYRAMMGDVLSRPADQRLIVMALLRPGWEADYDGTPPTYPIATVGEILHSKSLDDGRYLITLRGLERIRLTGEEAVTDGGYRVARVARAPESADGLSGSGVVDALVRLLDDFAAWTGGVPISVRREDLEARQEARGLVLNTLAFHLSSAAGTRQELLEEDDLARRLERLARIVADGLGGKRALDAWRPKRPDDPGVN
ncbi:MAG TPA: LON peptidase substrate-binding domain-containing protein [Candidatus Eisenbacteria bacterium]